MSSAVAWLMAAMAGESFGIVTVSGESILSASFGGTVTAGVRFSSSGIVSKNVNSIYTQIDAATDWIIPNSAAPDDYQVRCTFTGATPSGAATNTWLALSTTREWLVTDTTDNGVAVTSTLTIEIRKGTGAVISSGVYSLSAEVL